jgi:endonuclease/exonuclease/phosphatase family metal-dependent hydrolase
MQIKFLTLNIWIGGKLFDNVVHFLKKEHADIVVLQEVFRGGKNDMDITTRSFEALQQQLGYPYVEFAPTFYKFVGGQKIEEGNVILSKFPIITHASTFFDVPYGEYHNIPKNFPFCPRNMEEADISVGEKVVSVFNVHGIWGKHGDDTDRRMAMSNTILGKIKNKPYALLAGDFNLQPQTRAAKQIEKYMVSVFDNELLSSFNMAHKTNPGYATASVDMMFVTPNIHIIDHYMSLDDVSDHRPLVSILEI